MATFKKTVAMHEMFLTRLAHHPVFRNDHNLRVFLEYDLDLCVRGNISILYCVNCILRLVNIKVIVKYICYILLQVRIKWKCSVAW